MEENKREFKIGDRIRLGVYYHSKELSYAKGKIRGINNDTGWARVDIKIPYTMNVPLWDLYLDEKALTEEQIIKENNNNRNIKLIKKRNRWNERAN